MNTRNAEYPLNSLFISRWSPRSFTGQPISDTTLKSGFEAARRSPSGYNIQPWRFIYSKPDLPTWETFFGFLVERNRACAQKSSALVLLLSKKDYINNGQVLPSPGHSFNAGAAWMSFALQLHLDGWATHAMGGIEQGRIRADLEIPENFAIEAMIAVGKRGDKASLPSALEALEIPNDRLPLNDIVHEGSFKNDWR